MNKIKGFAYKSPNKDRIPPNASRKGSSHVFDESPSPVQSFEQTEQDRASDYKEGFKMLIQRKQSSDSRGANDFQKSKSEWQNNQVNFLFSPDSASKKHNKNFEKIRFMTEHRMQDLEAAEKIQLVRVKENTQRKKAKDKRYCSNRNIKGKQFTHMLQNKKRKQSKQLKYHISGFEYVSSEVVKESSGNNYYVDRCSRRLGLKSPRVVKNTALESFFATPKNINEIQLSKKEIISAGQRQRRNKVSTKALNLNLINENVNIDVRKSHVMQSDRDASLPPIPLHTFQEEKKKKKKTKRMKLLTENFIQKRFPQIKQNISPNLPRKDSVTRKNKVYNKSSRATKQMIACWTKRSKPNLSKRNISKKSSNKTKCGTRETNKAQVNPPNNERVVGLEGYILNYLASNSQRAIDTSSPLNMYIYNNQIWIGEYCSQVMSLQPFSHFFFEFPTIKQKISKDKFLYLYPQESRTAYKLSSVLSYYDGCLDTSQIKDILVSIVDIFIELDKNQIGADCSQPVNLLDSLYIRDSGPHLNLKFLVSGSNQNLFQMQKDKHSQNKKIGLRKLLGLMMVNIMLNKNFNANQVNKSIFCLKSIRKFQNLEFDNEWESYGNQQFGSEVLACQKISAGLLNLMINLLECSNSFDLENLKEFFNRPDFGLKSWGSFRLDLRGVLKAYVDGKGREYHNDEQFNHELQKLVF